jgi:hypothetical protein
MPPSILAPAALHEWTKTLTHQEAAMQDLKDHFNRKARPAGTIDFVTYWSIFLTLLDLCRKLRCRKPDNLPPPPRPG